MFTLVTVNVCETHLADPKTQFWFILENLKFITHIAYLAEVLSSDIQEVLEVSKIDQSQPLVVYYS